jgi:phage terminase small subunit
MSVHITKQQEVFVAEYLVDMNATKAAIAAGYSARSARQTGSRLLKNPKISECIAQKREERCDRLNITADHVLQEYAILAHYDPMDLFESDGRVKQIKDMDPMTRKAITGLEVVELFEGSGDQKRAYGVLKKIKLADKGRSLEKLGRHLNLFRDKDEHSGRLTLEQLVCGEFGD